MFKPFADSFYKNIVLYMTQFWVRWAVPLVLSALTSSNIQFSFLNNFSGQIAYESWTLSLYNVVFTVLPPLVIGVFDQFVSARILDRYPQLYILGQKNAFFSKTAFWLWIGDALYHSLVSGCMHGSPEVLGLMVSFDQILFGFSVILFWGDLKQASGLDAGHWFWGTTLYLAVLLTVLGKAALISECVIRFAFRAGPPLRVLCINSLWTKYTVAGMFSCFVFVGHWYKSSHLSVAIPGSFVFTMLFLPPYAIIAPLLGFSTEYEGIVSQLWTNAVFYFMLLLVPILCLARDFAWK